MYRVYSLTVISNMAARHSVTSLRPSITYFTDPRIYQILSLGLVLLAGSSWFALPVNGMHVLICCATTLVTQWCCILLFRVPGFDVRSPLISGLSLSLLLRSQYLWPVVLAGVLAIASKYVLRSHGRHIFNPTNFGIAVVLLLTERAWISPGLWGHELLMLFSMICAGTIVILRTTRSDITWAFIGSFAALHYIRALYLGDPLVIPTHQLQNGTFLIFSFFMISDPRTVPDTRSGRIVFAMFVAMLAYYMKFYWFEPAALLYALILVSMTNPIFRTIAAGNPFEWDGSHRYKDSLYPGGGFMLRPVVLCSSFVVAGLLLVVSTAEAFCGFYVAKADTKLFNKASKVVLVRDEDKTVLTMANDFQGDPREFAVVIPVPTFIEEGQINVASTALIEHLDAYSSPRLVEYYDENPCDMKRYKEMMVMSAVPGAVLGKGEAQKMALDLGVTIEAEYTVGEYDIQILSAKESTGLETWLRQNGYQIPAGASEVLGSYLKQGMRFFVAKVNLEKQSNLGFTFLRPLQVAYESKKFMLPIRLGTVNADGDQELFIFALSRKGRIETTNYRTVKLPEGMDLPVYVKSEFADFYKDMFSTQVEKEKGRSVFLEYAWDMGWCDPCAANPLSTAELKELGVFWLAESGSTKPQPFSGDRMIAPVAPDVFITRMHLRYNGERFPEDLVFHETGDRTNFQARYVLRHPWTGSDSCAEADSYREALPARLQREAEQLAMLTGWEMNDIKEKMDIAGYRYPENVSPENVSPEEQPQKKWWERLW